MPSIAVDRGLGRGQRAVDVVGEDEEVAAANALLLHAEAFLQQALAFHHRHAPVALAADRPC